MSINFKDLNSVQKSAILLISLGVENASKVFNNLSQNDVEKLRFNDEFAGFAVLELGVKIRFPPPA